MRFFFALLSVFFIPLLSAQAALVPCGVGDGPRCTLCHIFVGGKGLIEWGMGIMVIVGLGLITLAGVRYVVSIGNASEMGKAKEMIYKVLGGIALILLGWLIVNTIINVLASPNMGVGIQKENWYKFSCDAQSSSANGTSTGTGASSGETVVPSRGRTSQAVCEHPDTMKSRLDAGGKVCTGTCKKGKCSFSESVDRAIREAELPAGVSRNLLAAIICQESAGRVTAENNSNGFKSCGLMQVNANEVSNTSCTGPAVNLTDPKVNIEKGLAILSRKFSQVNASLYTTVTHENQALAAYNCCGNGQNPNSESVSCSVASGWEKVPKWACPVDAGGMCVVREYACDVSLCVGQYTY